MSREGILKDKLPPWATGVQTQWDPLRSLRNPHEHQKWSGWGMCPWAPIPHWWRVAPRSSNLMCTFSDCSCLQGASSKGPEQALGRGERCRSGGKLLHTGPGLALAGKLRRGQARRSQALTAWVAPSFLERYRPEG